MDIGTRLLDRAAIHCRNADVDTLYMHFLSSNQSMGHIAKKAGMEVHHDHGEAEAYLKLPPADAASASQEVVGRFRAAVAGAGTEPPALKKTSSPTREVTMMKLPILILGFALTATTIADAAQVAGVSVPDSATVAGTKLMLNGAGLRKKAFFEVYVGALYLPSKAASAEAALGQNGPNRVAMHVLRDVDRESLVDAWSEGFAANNTPAEIAKLEARIDEFNALFSNVKKGQTIELDYLPDTGTEVRIAGQRKGTVAGVDFNHAMLRIWLGPKPPTEDLKNGMLGR